MQSFSPSKMRAYIPAYTLANVQANIYVRAISREYLRHTSPTSVRTDMRGAIYARIPDPVLLSFRLWTGVLYTLGLWAVWRHTTNAGLTPEVTFVQYIESTIFFVSGIRRFFCDPLVLMSVNSDDIPASVPAWCMKRNRGKRSYTKQLNLYSKPDKFIHLAYASL